MWPGATAAAVVATDARRCRWEMCGRKHFRYCQKYLPCPRACAEDQYPVLPSAASAVDLQLSATKRKVAFVSAADAEYKLADAFTACVCRRVCIVQVYRCIRKCKRVRSNVRLWTCLCAFTEMFSFAHLCCIKQQLQRPTTERVLLADLHAELRSLFVISRKLAGWSVHMCNMHPDFERGNYGKNRAYYNRIFTVTIGRLDLP